MEPCVVKIQDGANIIFFFHFFSIFSKSTLLQCLLVGYNIAYTRRSLSPVSQSGTAFLCSHLARFAHARFALCAHKHFRKKKYVSIVLKCSEMQRNAKKNYPFDPLRALHLAQWNFITTNRTKVPTFSSSLIKIWPIVSEI